jgi:hypothetical protein
LYGVDQLLQRRAQIGADGQRHWFIFVKFRSVNVNMNDLPVLDKFAHFSGHPIIEAHAHRHHEIGFVDCDVGVFRTVHPQDV